MVYAVGLMSGTSLDGVDAALVSIEENGADIQVTLVDFISAPIPPDVRDEIVDSLSVERSTVQGICSLNFKLGHLFAAAAKAVCDKANVPLSDICVIGSHGQTIWHQPEREGAFVPSTLQIGEPAVIAYETNVPVVSNFRTMDMAAGGQGAPLVPYTEWRLYRSEATSRLLQNIGGIGNVTIMPKRAKLEEVYAFDTGPGNMIIDEMCSKLFGVPYDKNGAFAARGTVNEAMLARCMSVPYIAAEPPKSTGRELFGEAFAAQMLAEYAHLSPYDQLATITMFTAKSIADSYQRFVFPHHKVDEIIVGGGGSYNDTLMNMLRDLLPGYRVLTQEDAGFSSEAKEAVAFALLAYETMNDRPSNVPSATGAKSAVILGNITTIKR
ncbi:anhydro-N-acetylmuramic acid kinase AnmK [Ectobacillus sp. JY-23]|uniref:anhydro-N-acetylmuramic acid kinase AnmK n=1 Tax=Ectobacillus sp. JY-23 TaxID=2933872 RepID=UPI001FF27EDA|nr:anhydro-N-acetylmuramic acid kinase AnmK [Ectobacillus sp. JY-23]UOY92526.1 anhydro-N-acetylmuramic acid kinase AnmK [Ectobacillus sp. JY-23]